MRYMIIMLALLCVAGTNLCHAEPPAADKPAEGDIRAVAVDRDLDGVMDGVDEFDKGGRLIRKGFNAEADGQCETWETYDPQTGMLKVPGESEW
ncbi:MAG: hypothetical protein JW919_07205 [Candidatus Omnitrophica bacterium]|nr:hypothetical protein [Candidatus Omnitrophota bacterium]